ncbi:MAG: phage portal protein, partial [Ruminococcus sp.]|nr:phage portal protein [Ruminococcus sp.]
LTVVCACVRILAEAVAGLPLHMYRYTDRGKEKAIDNRLYYLLHDEPNPEMTSFTFRETMMAQLLTTGNAYAQKIFNNRGEIVAIYPLISAQMQVLRDPSGRLVYLYTYMPDDSKPNETQVVTLRQDEVWNIPGLGFNGLIGFSPIEMARNALGLAMATEEYGSKFFANGAQPSGVLEHPGTIKDPEKLRTMWQAQFGGSGNSNKTAVLEEGLKYHPISIPPDQAQFLESRKFQINEICRMYRIPPHMVGDLEKSSFSNIEQQSLEFVKYTLDPWLCRWEQSMQRCLLTRDDKQRYFWKFNVDGLLRGDYQSRMQGYAVGRQNGWLNANDIRELENMDEIPAAEGGDLYLVNGNMLPLGQAGNFYNNGGEAQ